MANWDHKSNIGLHPGLDPDPAVRLPVLMEAAQREFNKAFDKIAAISAEAARQGIDLGAAISRAEAARQGVDSL